MRSIDSSIWLIWPCILSDLRVAILFLSALTLTLMSHHCAAMERQKRRRHRKATSMPITNRINIYPSLLFFIDGDNGNARQKRIHNTHES